MTRRTTSLPVLKLPHYGWLPPIKNVQVQTHSRCNADCVFCPYVESTHHASPGRMTDQVWQLVLLNLLPWRESINTGKFCPYLMQEPLLDKTIFAKIADIYRHFPDTCVEVSTNGAALTPRAADELLAAMRGRRHDIWISHHGVDRESFEHIMQIDYERATANLLYLLRVAAGQFTIKIRGAGESRDGRHQYFSGDEYCSYWAGVFEREGVDTRNVSIDAFTFHDRAGTLLRDDRGANTMNVGVVRQIDPAHPFHCSRLDEWVHVMWDGTIRLCCMDYHGEVPLPNVTRMSLVDYFHGPEYRALVEKVSGRTACASGFICTRCNSPGG